MEFLGLHEPKNILVIEDNLSFADQLIHYLEARGQTVFGYAGVAKVEENILTGSTALTDTSIEIDLSKIQIAFLDHYFEGDRFDGTSLTKMLVPMGIKVCGMSSVDPANASMLRYGAVCAYRKPILSSMLLA